MARVVLDRSVCIAHAVVLALSRSRAGERGARAEPRRVPLRPRRARFLCRAVGCSGYCSLASICIRASSAALHAAREAERVLGGRPSRSRGALASFPPSSHSLALVSRPRLPELLCILFSRPHAPALALQPVQHRAAPSSLGRSGRPRRHLQIRPRLAKQRRHRALGVQVRPAHFIVHSPTRTGARADAASSAIVVRSIRLVLKLRRCLGALPLPLVRAPPCHPISLYRDCTCSSRQTERKEGGIRPAATSSSGGTRSSPLSTDES